MENQMIIEYSVDRFTWNPEERQFTAFASDFGPARDGGMKLSTLYDDACDMGFRLIGAKTGEFGGLNRVTYYLAHGEVKEGDLLWNDFLPTAESVRRVPASAGTRVRVFND